MKKISDGGRLVGICVDVSNENIKSICEAISLGRVIIGMEDIKIVSRKVVNIIPAGIVSKKECAIEEIEYEYTGTIKHWYDEIQKRPRLHYQFRLIEIDKVELEEYPLSEARKF